MTMTRRNTRRNRNAARVWAAFAGWRCGLNPAVEVAAVTDSSLNSQSFKEDQATTFLHH